MINYANWLRRVRTWQKTSCLSAQLPTYVYTAKDSAAASGSHDVFRVPTPNPFAVESIFLVCNPCTKHSVYYGEHQLLWSVSYVRSLQYKYEFCRARSRRGGAICVLSTVCVLAGGCQVPGEATGGFFPEHKYPTNPSRPETAIPNIVSSIIITHHRSHIFNFHCNWIVLGHAPLAPPGDSSCQ